MHLLEKLGVGEKHNLTPCSDSTSAERIPQHPLSLRSAFTLNRTTYPRLVRPAGTGRASLCIEVRQDRHRPSALLPDTPAVYIGALSRARATGSSDYHHSDCTNTRRFMVIGIRLVQRWMFRRGTLHCTRRLNRCMIAVYMYLIQGQGSW